MPYEITFEMTPLGHAAEAVRKGSSVKVCYSAFLSSEDGQEFIHRLEDFPNHLLGKIPFEGRIPPSQVDHILAVIRRDKTATLYVNELTQVLGIISGRSIPEGEHVFKNDIVDIATMRFEGVSVPDDAGVFLVFSVGWRKGLYYDFSPLDPNLDIRRSVHLPTIFGQCFSHVLFQERFGILEAEWDSLFKAKWFPFAGLQK